MRNKREKIIYKLSQTLHMPISEIKTVSDEQAAYINEKLSSSSFLQACPGSGKTEVIGLKGAYEINRWKNQIGGIAILTFTNSAALELSNRIRKYADLTAGLFPHFIGTFDSWMHNFLFQPYCHYLFKYAGIDGDKSIRVIEDDSHADFLNAYSVNLSRKNRTIPVRATDYHFSIDAKTIIPHSELVEGLLRELTTQEFQQLRINKAKFIRGGFATYSDAEMISIVLLEKHDFLRQKLSKRFPVIIIDECQDLSDNQIKILNYLKENGSSIHFVGDLDQSIYEFRKVNPDHINEYIGANNFKILRLTKNYRSCQPIVNVSKNLIGVDYEIMAIPNTISKTPCVLWQYTSDNFTELPLRFEEHLKENNISIDRSVIIARGKSTLIPLKTQTDKSKFSKTQLFAVAIECWHKSPNNTQDLTNALYYLGRAFCLLAYNGKGDYRNQYCPEVYATIEWRLFLRDFLKYSKSLYPFEADGANLSYREWVPKLKKVLEAYWIKLKEPDHDFESISNKIRSPSGFTNSPVKANDNSSKINNRIRTTTIHSVKGETVDAALLISHPDKKSQGGHFSHWFREGRFNPEHIRFAYVACSRPKHLLVIATPTLSQNDLAKLESLGLSSL